MGAYNEGRAEKNHMVAVKRLEIDLKVGAAHKANKASRERFARSAGVIPETRFVMAAGACGRTRRGDIRLIAFVKGGAISNNRY
jgi:hypothetical protein